MTEAVIELLRDHGMYAAVISIGLNILVTVIGVLPTFFITGANVVLFGFWLGVLVSFLGESLGAVTAFLLYRAGLRAPAQRILDGYPRTKNLVNARGREAFQLVVLLRMLPFTPAIVATLGAAVGKVSLGLFAAASTLGKIPALLMEAYAVYEVSRFQLTGKIILAILALWLAFDVSKRLRRNQDTDRSA